MFTSLAVASNGDFYWTSASSLYTYNDIVYEFLGNPTGRLFRYSRRTKTNHLLVDNLFLLKAVSLSPNEDFVVVAESNLKRITKYNLKGPRAGHVEIFLDGLPGLPDNLVADERGHGFWVSLSVAVDPDSSDKPNLLRQIAPLPQVREFIVNLLKVTESSDGLLKPDVPDYVQTDIKSYVGGCVQFEFAIPKRATVLRVDWTGKIVQALYALDGSITTLSHAVFKDGYLYLGSAVNNYIARYKC